MASFIQSLSALFYKKRREMTDRNDDDKMLPPRPGEKKPNQSSSQITGEVPITIYINGQSVTMSKAEALGAAAQIAQILLYLETTPKQEANK